MVYITDTIMIMSRPSSNIFQFSSDSLQVVKQCLEKNHRNAYKIFDVCIYEHNDDKNAGGVISILSTMVKISTTPLSFSSKMKDKNIISSKTASIKSDADLKENDEEYAQFQKHISDKYSFDKNHVISMNKLFEYCQEASDWCEISDENVIIVQSESGLGRAMFLCACLIMYYYPTAPLRKVLHFVQNERLQNISGNGKELDSKDYQFNKFLPSQIRFYQYFSSLLAHAIKIQTGVNPEKDLEEKFDVLFENRVENEMDSEAEILDVFQCNNYWDRKHFTSHLSTIHDRNTFVGSFSANTPWNYYVGIAQQVLDQKIGIVIKSIDIQNMNTIDPYLQWNVNIVQWKNREMDNLSFDVFEFGTDENPSRTRALIRRDSNVSSKILENEFCIRLFSISNEEIDESSVEEKDESVESIVDKQSSDRKEDGFVKKKLIAQLWLHSHFLHLDDENSITFYKNEIDFVNRDLLHKKYPKNFKICIKAKIFRKK